MERTLGIHRDAPFPPVVFAGKTFQRWARRRPTLASARRLSTSTVARRTGTSPEPSRLAVELLERVGYRVVVPPQDAAGCRFSRTECSRLRDAMPLRLARARPGIRARGLDIVALHELQPDAETRGSGVSTSRTTGYFEWSPSGPRHLRMAARPARRGDLPDDFRPGAAHRSVPRPASGAATEIGRPALDLLALVPGSRWTISTRTAAA